MEALRRRLGKNKSTIVLIVAKNCKKAWLSTLSTLTKKFKLHLITNWTSTQYWYKRVRNLENQS